MKYKFFSMLVLAVILSNCEISPRKANANGRVYRVSCKTSDHECIGMDRFTVDGMEFLGFSMTGTHSSPFIINLTKEKLEIELLRKQLDSLR